MNVISEVDFTAYNLQECAFYLTNVDCWIYAFPDIHDNVRSQNL